MDRFYMFKIKVFFIVLSQADLVFQNDFLEPLFFCSCTSSQ